jgi:co-chaperonin GroES (HSP10)
MHLTPAPDHLVVQVIEQPTESSQGILMARTSVNEPPRGTVISLGENARDQLRTLEPQYTVYFAPATAHSVNRDGMQYVVIDYRSVLAWETSSPQKTR